MSIALLWSILVLPLLLGSTIAYAIGQLIITPLLRLRAKTAGKRSAKARARLVADDGRRGRSIMAKDMSPFHTLDEFSFAPALLIGDRFLLGDS